MSKRTGLTWLVLAWLLLGAALLLVGVWGTASKAEIQAGKIEVDPIELTVSEPDGTGVFTLTLSAEPVATVFVDLAVSNDQCAVSTSVVSLDATNWATGASVTVFAVDDSIVDGTQVCFVRTGAARSDDPNFDGVNPRDVKVTVDDDDEPGILVVPTTLTVTEPSGSDSFTVTLTTQPSGTVSIPLSASNEQCSVSPSAVALDAGNWSAGVNATVSAVDDAVQDGTQICVIQTGPSTGDDPAYVGLDPEDVTVTVLDDDEFIVVVDPTSLTISEPTGSGSFNLTLTEEPTATVSVSLTASNSQCAVSPDSVDLNAGNWSTGVTALVTAVDDPIVDGTQTCLVETGPATSDDPRYDGRNPEDVTVTVYDNDEADILVDPSSLIISEPSGFDSFTLTLTSQPISPVSVSLTASNDECTVSPSSVDLDADNWASGATALVTAIDDLITDGTQTCLIETGPATSEDPNYFGIDPEDVTVTVYDDEEAGILVEPTTLTISEPIGADFFELTLVSQPTSAVTVPLSTSSSECKVSPSSVDLDAANWAAGVIAIVTAVDDSIVDGTQTCLVETGPATSEDPSYNGRDPEDVLVTVYDNDEPGILVDPTNLAVSEPSGSDTFALTLTSQPISSVSVSLSASNSQCTVSPASVDLDAGNWASGVDVTVTAVDDLIQDGAQSCLVETEPAISEDPNYQGRDPEDVTVTVYDDDGPDILVIPTALSISEPSGSDIFTLRLTGQPAAPVSVDLTATSSQCTVSPTSISLDTSNWSTGATVTVTAVDDALIDGTQDCLVETGPAESADPDYSGRDPEDVLVTVYDDDEPGVLVDPTTMSVSEPAGSGVFTLTLASKPAARMFVDLSVSNSQCTVLPASLELDAANWSTGVTATVTAADDLIQDGTQICLVETGLIFSADPNYAGLDPDDVVVTVLDDDVPGVIVAPTTLTVSEPSGSGVVTLSLTGQPRATVSVSLSPANNQCSVAPTSVSLNATNWYAGLDVTVTAVDDLIPDGTQDCLIQIGLTDSVDPDYDGLDPEDITVAVQDNDSAFLVYLPSIVRTWPPLPGVPTLYAIDNPQGLRTYTVGWSLANRAESYVLEEASDPAFTDSHQIYVGTSTSHTVSGQMTGRYYYRVKGRNAWGDSAWSPRRSADVRWEVEPNNGIAQANGPIVSGLTYYGTFPETDPEEDQRKDYFFFELTASHRVQVWLTNIPAGRNYDLVLRRGDTSAVEYSVELGNADEYINVPSLAPGLYYIQVYRTSGAASSQPYHLRVVYE
jgi:hypothetical protein